jgi:hypothetical protein
MRESARIQSAVRQGAPILVYLAQEEISPFRHPVPMGMELDIDDGGIKRADLLGMHQGDHPAADEVTPVQPRSSREPRQPLVLLVR